MCGVSTDDGDDGVVVRLQFEDILEMAQLPTPGETTSEDADVAFEPVVGLPLVVELEILRLLLVESVLQREVVEVCLLYTSDAADD